MAKTEAARIHAAIMEIINSKLLSRSVCLAAELAIADHLRNGAEDVASLAAKTGTNVDALYRVMRLLAASGIFVERPQRRFENNPSSEILRSDASGSLRHYARWIGSDFHWKMVTGLDYSVKTGKPSLQKDEPQKDPFEILAEDRIADIKPGAAAAFIPRPPDPDFHGNDGQQCGEHAGWCGNEKDLSRRSLQIHPRHQY